MRLAGRSEILLRLTQPLPPPPTCFSSTENPPSLPLMLGSRRLSRWRRRQCHPRRAHRLGVSAGRPLSLSKCIAWAQGVHPRTLQGARAWGVYLRLLPPRVLLAPPLPGRTPLHVPFLLCDIMQRRCCFCFCRFHRRTSGAGRCSWWQWWRRRWEGGAIQASRSGVKRKTFLSLFDLIH